MKRRALSWFMAAALGVGTMAGGIGSANIVLAEEQKEETEAADETSEEPADETDSDSSVMKIGALKGPTAMGMAQLLDDENYEFSLAASPDEIVPMIVQGQVDVPWKGGSWNRSSEQRDTDGFFPGTCGFAGI